MLGERPEHRIRFVGSSVAALLSFLLNRFPETKAKNPSAALQISVMPFIL